VRNYDLIMTSQAMYPLTLDKSAILAVLCMIYVEGLANSQVWLRDDHSGRAVTNHAAVAGLRLRTGTAFKS